MGRALKLTIFFLTLLSLLTGCVGTYFVNFALARQEFNPDLVDKKENNEEFSFIPSDQIQVKENYNRILEETTLWYEGSEKEVWSLYSDDGLRLEAEFFPKEDSHKYAIMIHGYTSNREGMFPHAMYFSNWGFNVLTPDNRSHGKSEGQYIGMGWLDSRDILLWINRIVEQDPQAKITMLGVSMGGATVMMASGLELPDNVKCLIEDCGYSSVWDEFADRLKVMFRLPAWPVLNWSDKASKRIVGYGLKEASSLEMLAKTDIPMLFIHGTQDTFVNYSMLDKNIEAIGDTYHEVLRVQGAVHGTSIFTEPELYTSTVKQFTERFIDR